MARLVKGIVVIGGKDKEALLVIPENSEEAKLVEEFKRHDVFGIGFRGHTIIIVKEESM